MSAWNDLGERVESTWTCISVTAFRFGAIRPLHRRPFRSAAAEAWRAASDLHMPGRGRSGVALIPGIDIGEHSAGARAIGARGPAMRQPDASTAARPRPWRAGPERASAAHRSHILNADRARSAYARTDARPASDRRRSARAMATSFFTVGTETPRTVGLPIGELVQIGEDERFSSPWREGIRRRAGWLRARSSRSTTWSGRGDRHRDAGAVGGAARMRRSRVSSTTTLWGHAKICRPELVRFDVGAVDRRRRRRSPVHVVRGLGVVQQSSSQR